MSAHTLAALMVYLGGALMLTGIVTGGGNILSGQAPLWMTGGGVALMYVALVIVAARALWRMDE